MGFEKEADTLGEYLQGVASELVYKVQEEDDGGSGSKEEEEEESGTDSSGEEGEAHRSCNEEKEGGMGNS